MRPGEVRLPVDEKRQILARFATRCQRWLAWRGGARSRRSFRCSSSVVACGRFASRPTSLSRSLWTRTPSDGTVNAMPEAATSLASGPGSGNGSQPPSSSFRADALSLTSAAPLLLPRRAPSSGRSLGEAEGRGAAAELRTLSRMRAFSRVWARSAEGRRSRSIVLDCRGS